MILIHHCKTSSSSASRTVGCRRSILFRKATVAPLNVTLPPNVAFRISISASTAMRSSPSDRRSLFAAIQKRRTRARQYTMIKIGTTDYRKRWFKNDGQAGFGWRCDNGNFFGRNDAVDKHTYSARKAYFHLTLNRSCPCVPYGGSMMTAALPCSTVSSYEPPYWCPSGTPMMYSATPFSPPKTVVGYQLIKYLHNFTSACKNW